MVSRRPARTARCAPSRSAAGTACTPRCAALRLLTDDLTAIVTVADDGGSSGRIRRELKVLPPGDLRMALAALAGADPEHAAWAELLQHRLGGSGVLAGHPVGNLMLTGLLEREHDPVDALAALGRAGRRRRPGAADEPGPARPGRPRPTASTPTTRAPRAHIRGQMLDRGHPRAGGVGEPAAHPGRRPARPPSTPSARPTSWCSGPVVVHQRHPAPAAARAGHDAGRHPGPAARRAEPGAAGGETDDYDPARAAASCCRPTPSRSAACRSTPCWPTTASVLDPQELAPLRRRAGRPSRTV